MEERQEQQVEITFRLSAGLLGELARLVAAVSGGEEGTQERVPAPAQPLAVRQEQEAAASQTFDPERFQTLAHLEADPALPERPAFQAGMAELPSRAVEQPSPETGTPARQGRNETDLPWREAPGVQETELPRPDIPEAAEPDLMARERGTISMELSEAAGSTAPSAPSWAAQVLGSAPAGMPRREAETLSRRFERDSRRYDGGFPLY